VTSLQIQQLDAHGNPVGNALRSRQRRWPAGCIITMNDDDADDRTYVFKWKPKGLDKGNYVILLKLADGTTHSAFVMLT